MKLGACAEFPQAEFISAEDDKFRRKGSQTRIRVWEMRGAYTIEDDTKEKTEFNLSKNFL